VDDEGEGFQEDWVCDTLWFVLLWHSSLSEYSKFFQGWSGEKTEEKEESPEMDGMLPYTVLIGFPWHFLHDSVCVSGSGKGDIWKRMNHFVFSLYFFMFSLSSAWLSISHNKGLRWRKKKGKNKLERGSRRKKKSFETKKKNETKILCKATSICKGPNFLFIIISKYDSLEHT
jgi:hypothetical protein